MPKALILDGTPDPPPPGAPTLTYSYPNQGRPGKNYVTDTDMTTALTEKNMLGIQVSYVVETRWFNSFRAEHVAMYDRSHTERVATGRTERHHNAAGMCWTLEEVAVRKYDELGFYESIQYEIWRINETRDEYYQFLTGVGGVVVEANALAATTSAANASTTLSTASAQLASTLGTAASTEGVTVALLSDAAVVVGAAGQAIGVGVTAFLATTQVVVWWNEDDRMTDGAGARNAAGVKLAEGWQNVRLFWDRPILVDEQFEWRTLVEMHPCTPEERPLDDPTLPAPRRVSTGEGKTVREERKASLFRMALLPAGLLLIAILAAIGLNQRNQERAGTTPTASVTASPTSTAVTVAAAPPVVTELKKVLVAPVTTWSVVANDPAGGPLTYRWELTPNAPVEACGTPRAPWTQSGASVFWSHNSGPPDSCAHTAADHAVTVILTVTNQKGVSVKCSIKGTESEAVTKPDCR